MLVRFSTIGLALFVMVLLSSMTSASEARLNFVESYQLTHVFQQEMPELTKASSQNDYNHDSFARITIPQAFLFNHEQQNSANFFLISEGVIKKLSPRFFKNLVNPPKALPWYIKLSHHRSSSRVSGWKDSNNLYTASLTYHS